MLATRRQSDRILKRQSKALRPWPPAGSTPAMIGNVVDGAALVTQTRSTAAFGDNAESDIGELAQSPDI